MLGWLIWAITHVASAAPAEVPWATMQAGAEQVIQFLPEQRWERATESVAVDLLVPISGDRLVVGQLNVALQGLPIPAAIEVWDARTGDRLWSIGRPWVEGAYWEVIHEEPLIVAGRSATSSTVLALDPLTGESLWSTSTEHSLVQSVGESIVVWRRGSLEGLDRASGNPVWKVPMQPPSAIHVGNGALMVEAADAVVAIEAAFGAPDWRVAGRWQVTTTSDDKNVALYSNSEVRWLDAFGELLWTWPSAGSPLPGDDPESRITHVTGADERAVVVVSGRDGDRVVVLHEGLVVGTVPLQGRAASSPLAIHGVLVLTTEDEILAFSPTDGTLAFRSPLPDGFLGWGPSDRPDLPHGQQDVLHAFDEQVVVIRERAGIAAYNAAHFGAGDLAWWQAHASVGAEPLTVAGRFEALNEAMASDAKPDVVDGQIARRRMEFEAARRRAHGPLGGRYYSRPFRRPAEDGTGAHGVTVVDLATGHRADVVYAPLFAPAVENGVDLPAVALDAAHRQLVVASTAPRPMTWRRIAIGDATVPGVSVRTVPLSTLPFAAESTTLDALDDLYPPLRSDVSSAAGPVGAAVAQSADDLLLAEGGPSPENCIQLGIVEQDRPDVVDACLAAKVQLVQPPPHGESALLMAAHHNRLETVRRLLDAGADPNLSSRGDGRRAVERTTDPDVIVLITSRGGEPRPAKETKAELKELLALSGLRKPNAPWCFHHGSRGRTDVIEACLAYRKSGVLGYVDPDEGHLLHVAALAGRIEHVRLLLEAGANPNIRDSAGKSPLGRLDEVETLNAGAAKAARLLELRGGM